MLFRSVIAASVTSGSGATVTYATTVTFGVPSNTALDRIPLVPEYGDSTPNGPPAEIGATVTTAGAGGVPAAAEIKLSALQAAAAENEPPVQLTVPRLRARPPKSQPPRTQAALPAPPAPITRCLSHRALPSLGPTTRLEPATQSRFQAPWR